MYIIEKGPCVYIYRAFAPSIFHLLLYIMLNSLQVLTNPWCSSGGLAADGTLVGTGGWKEGGKSVRLLSGCATCDWEDSPNALSGYRWYLMLNDYRFIFCSKDFPDE